MSTSNRTQESARRRRLPVKLRRFAARAALSIAISSAMVTPVVVWAAPFDIIEITVSDIEAGLAAGTFTAVELLQAHLDRIDTYESNYNAFTFFSPTAMAEAAALDAEYAISGPRSPLHGVPIVIKEAMDEIRVIENGMARNTKRLDDAKQRHESFINFASQQIDKIENVDPAEVITELNAASVQIEASYITISQIQGLTLGNYIR